MSERACPFCDYAGPSKVLWRTENFWPEAIAFEPINPVTPGHVLVVFTDLHFASPQEDETMAGELLRRAGEYAAHAGVQDCNFIINDGALAGQTVPHLHIHVVPRRSGDGLVMPWDARPNPQEKP